MNLVFENIATSIEKLIVIHENLPIQDLIERGKKLEQTMNSLQDPQKPKFWEFVGIKANGIFFRDVSKKLIFNVPGLGMVPVWKLSEKGYTWNEELKGYTKK